MDLFGDEPPPAPPPPAKHPRRAAGQIGPALHDVALQNLAAQMPANLHMGTSSWNFPGWAGLVWDREHAESSLSRQGLQAYAAHPLLQTVSVDRSFYRPMSASQYAAYAAQVPEGFRFVVKAPSLVTDALIRSVEGQGREPNPGFLDPTLATAEFVQPALEGLGARIGALVFQLSPLPARMLADTAGVLARLRAMLTALPALRPTAPDGVIAVEVRNPELLGPALAGVLRDTGATYCLGLHARMPPIEDQLPMLRALWPGPLVCRWSLHRRHGAQGYEAAKDLYAPFNALVDPDPDTRAHLVRVIRATTDAGYKAYVTINNKAEGSAPLSVLAVAQALAPPASASVTPS